MQYQEKKALTTVISGLLVLAAYYIYSYSRYQAIGEELLKDLKFWSSTMLSFMGIGIITTIIALIVLHIAMAAGNEIAKEVAKATRRPNHEDLDFPTFEDERDKLISLKAIRISSLVTCAGMVIALVSLLLEMPPGIMLNILYFSFSVSLVADGLSQLYFYRNGV